jgi:glycine amidinotransferase
MINSSTPLVAADTEWSRLHSVILGRAEHSCFPLAPPHMIKATMPEEHFENFKPDHPFPAELLKKADEELAQFASILQENGVQVYRPKRVEWSKFGGYTGAMPRDGLLTVGNTIIEACFSWECRHQEVELAYARILDELAKDSSVKVVRAPKVANPDAIYEGVGECKDGVHGWAINNSRPAFDAADFLRFGKVLIGQLSNVTNQKGVEYLQKVIPEGYTVELLDTTDEYAMHIDATILPLRKGLLIYNSKKVSEASLRKHQLFQDWELHAYPHLPAPREYPPRYMTSGWLLMNVLSLDEKRVVVEAGDQEFAEYIKNFGMEPILCPFQHVNSIGGSFHCATVDLVRD